MIHPYMGVEPKIGGFYPQNGWLKIMENPIKMDDLGTIIFGNTHIHPSSLEKSHPGRSGCWQSQGSDVILPKVSS